MQSDIPPKRAKLVDKVISTNADTSSVASPSFDLKFARFRKEDNDDCSVFYKLSVNELFHRCGSMTRQRYRILIGNSKHKPFSSKKSRSKSEKASSKGNKTIGENISQGLILIFCKKYPLTKKYRYICAGSNIL